MQNGYTVEERDYFKDQFTETELRELVSELGEPGVSGIFAARSPALKKMGLNVATCPTNASSPSCWKSLDWFVAPSSAWATV